MKNLYYSQPHADRLVTTVSALKENNTIVQLAETLIYPGGGGQLADRAWIAGIAVEEVITQREAVFYRLKTAFQTQVGKEVELKIDKEFREYNSCQHTAQHILSALFDGHGFKTVSTHLGQEYTAVEVTGGEPDLKLITELEIAANQIIREARTVKTYFVTPQEAQKLPLRKEPGDYDTLRIVEIENLDLSACAGTHVGNCAEIGLIKYTGLQKVRNNVRLHYKVASRAYNHYNSLHQTGHKLSQMLNVAVENIPQRVENLFSEKKELLKKLKLYRNAWVEQKMGAILADNSAPFWMYDSSDNEEAELVARYILKNSSKAGVCFANNRFFFIHMDKVGLRMMQFIKEEGAFFALKGGGPPDFVSGVFTPEKKQDLLQTLIKKVKVHG